jgi:hypothetical protein
MYFVKTRREVYTSFSSTWAPMLATLSVTTTATTHVIHVTITVISNVNVTTSIHNLVPATLLPPPFFGKNSHPFLFTPSRTVKSFRCNPDMRQWLPTRIFSKCSWRPFAASVERALLLVTSAICSATSDTCRLSRVACTDQRISF